ncbi:MAG: ferritin-like domain-containing protein [Planctomycetes bacterium]|nr:ferritin-like domain-containing protein [Planctomycetota bacterium]
MHKNDDLKSMLVDELQDLYSAETQLLKALPELAKAASSPDLRKGLQDHLQQTQTHVKRLDEVLKGLNSSHSGRKCKAMEGLIAEGDEVIKKKNGHGGDASLICAAQKVEHYEMAGYGCARTWAETLGMSHEAKLLQQTLEEERAADAKLSQLAVQRINMEAAACGSHGG